MRVIIQEEALRRSEGHYYHHFIHELPTIDAVPVVHARWKWEGRFKACSECGTYIDWDNTLGAGHWHYCPNCGAKMDLKEE